MDEIANIFFGRGGEKLLHIEHWSNPDAETFLTGIDYYEHPRLCRERMNELYPCLRLCVPKTDMPIPRPADIAAADGEAPVFRWGDSVYGLETHGGRQFQTAEDVLRFSPLENCDYRDRRYVVMPFDYSDEERLFEQMYADYSSLEPTMIGNGSLCYGFYNTMFMWPLLTFGWEWFLECCLDDGFGRIMEEFAEINRRAYRCMARLPAKFIYSHDDLCMASGPVCPPWWLNRYIYPMYEELWGILKAAGKEIVFICDGNADKVIDDVMACGALGLIGEPATNYKAIARRHRDCYLAGEGDNRILHTGDKDLIRKMVESMVETGQMSRGYMMCVGNHIPWNVNPDGVKYYLEYSQELGYRRLR